MKQATILTEFESLILKIFFCMMLKYIHNENSTYEPLLLVFVIDLCIVVYIYTPNDTIPIYLFIKISYQFEALPPLPWQFPDRNDMSFNTNEPTLIHLYIETAKKQRKKIKMKKCN